MLTMAEHTPQIEKGEGLESHTGNKAPDVSDLNLTKETEEGHEVSDKHVSEVVDDLLKEQRCHSHCTAHVSVVFVTLKRLITSYLATWSFSHAFTHHHCLNIVDS